MSDNSKITSPAFDASNRPEQRKNESIADWLGRRIVSGAIGPDETVPKEMDFLAETGISRGAYREALRRLAGKGMLVTKTRSGTRVAPREKWSLLDPDVVRWSFESGAPPDWYIRAIYELRAMIEPPAAAFAAERRSEDDLRLFRDALHSMRYCDMTEESWHNADASFHRAILISSHNPVLLSLEAGICAAVAFTTAFRYRDMPNPHTRNPVEEHAAVFERIEARDSVGARQLMTGLVDTALLDSRGTTVFDLGLPTLKI
ncbi:FadR/GntR family transcriptional regulator [Paracoccus saliphilus]|uniref:DNA-binding transcriptional regulator, FadR family n=1 Tax=Paracoccus saliphilus TaxID=405559 RepID=A0AA45W589_9RHOB|nr:FadR/GntR family transcriptional regulator [Paracoccus saliphilus]WCR02226.1 FadR family transcriptional regulator [Paracoccus saliphilus]SIS91516.1 DNA-binding transcriptional regulator, FadR family [Paracoccus saliphilus]